SDVSADTTIADAARTWLAEIDRYVADGIRAPNTGSVYRSVVVRHIEPGIGALRLREATVPRLDAFLVAFRSQHGASLTKTVRTTLSGIMGYAVRMGAVERNPVRDLSRIPSGRKRLPRALTAAERDEWLARMDADDVAAWRDLPDITRFQLATGCRIGETLAVSFDEVDVDDKLVH